MTDDLYERYKDALRTGHVAVLRGQLDEALEAYREAVGIAPARALPHTSLGGVYLRLNRVEEALAEYAAAVARAPQDEGALLGQAEALSAVGRYEDGAAALDRVAQIQEAAGRLPEASDTLRRALELDDMPERMRRHRALVRQIRLSAGDQAAEHALARALRLREETPLADAPSVAFGPSQAVSRGGRPLPETLLVEPLGPVSAVDSAPVEMETPAGEPPEPLHAAGDVEAVARAADMPETLAESSEPAFDIAGAGIAAGIGLEAEALESSLVPDAVRAEAQVEPIGVMDEGETETAPIGVDVPLPERRGADELVAAAEAEEARGNPDAARALLVDAAREYAREGRFDAGLDLAQQLIRDRAGDVDAHLVLVELYVSRSWDGIAAEKLILLGRLADLDDDEDTKVRLCAAASQAFPLDGRLSSLCA